MRTVGDAQVVVKEAESAAERTRLGHEAAMLRSAAHPGVVRLVGVEGGEAPDRPDRLVLQRVAGTDLTSRGTQSSAAVAGWGAAVATVLADLHDLGLVHGDIRAEHVVLDEHGRPVLCGFASARRVSREERSAPFDADVQALASMIAERLPAGEVALRRMLTGWGRGRGRRAHRAGARALARILVQRVPAARIGNEAGHEAGHGVGAGVTGPEMGGGTAPTGHATRAETGEAGSEAPPTEPVTSRTSRAAGRLAALERRSVRVVLLAVGAVVVAVLLVHGFVRRPGGAAGRVLASAVPAFVVQVGPGEEPVTVVGHWNCGAARPAVLDAASGSIWLFSDWPVTGSTTTGKLVGRIKAARGLGVVSDRPGCDRLIALRSGSPDLPVSVAAGG